MPGAVEFYFDYISPYAYLAWTQLPSLAALHGREVRLVPVLFAGLLNAHGTKGPAEVPAKRAYVIKDSWRKATALGVPCRPPPSHPFNPLLALRATCAALEPRFVDRLYHAVWGSGTGVETAEQVGAAAREAGLDADDVLARANEPAIKQQLRENTERAVALGVFGIPTMIVDGELFWGVDSLAHLDRFLAGGEPVDPSIVGLWDSIRPSAAR